MKKDAIKTENLTKDFNGQVVVNHCDMSVKKGSIYGILGANGVGKTTLFKLLIGLIRPSEGSIEILGMPATDTNKESILRQIGSLIETPEFYEHLSAKENLEIHLSYMGVSGVDIQEVLEKVGLNRVENKQVSNFSLGMRQRLAIARAIIHKPKLLILDEPINGLDPIGIKEIRHLFLKLVKEDEMMILLSSHILSEIQHVADTIAVMMDGKIVEEVNIEKIKQHHGSLEDYFFEVMSGGKSGC